MLTQQVFGTCKVKDGLYIGDEFAAKVFINYTPKDLEFIVANKVGYIVNCSSDTLENLFEGVGVMYFSFQWPEQQPELVVQEEFINHVYEFIEESVQQGQSCLITSQHGQSRACSMVTIYLMKRFQWCLYKTLEFLNSRRNDLEIKTSFFTVLNSVENLLNPDTLTKKWEILPTSTVEEILIINTFQNAQAKQIDSMYTTEEEFQKISNKSIIQLIKFKDSYAHTKHNPYNQYKSILKGSNKLFYKIFNNPSNTSSLNPSGRNKPLKSLSLNKENINIPEISKKPIIAPLQKSTLRSSSIPKNQTIKKTATKPPTGNQVVYPVKILRPKMPNFENL